MSTFSPEQLNFFKFSTVVLDEFPVALRLVFAFMWDTLVASGSSQKWDDSPKVRSLFLAKEGGKTKYVPTRKSFNDWDCTALFEATLFAQSFARPDGRGGLATLSSLYVKPRRLPKGTFHSTVISSSGDQAETFALALDQLRLLRNSLCHQIDTKQIGKRIFGQYIQLAKDAFAALRQNTAKIDDIGKLSETDFPTTRVQELEKELRTEKFKQIEDNLDQIECQVKDVGSAVDDVKSEVTAVTDKVDEVKSGVEDVNTTVTDVNTTVKDVKTGVVDVTKKVEEVGSEITAEIIDVKAKVTELKANVDDIKQAIQRETAAGPSFPAPCIPDKIPHFVGRQEECEAVLDRLTAGCTRLVDIWGPPGFGKTSLAINVAHRLREKEIPVYFISLRGMRSIDELVSRLLSVLGYVKQFPSISPAHWLLQCLQQFQGPFVLMLDNADDLLESKDTKLKEEVLRFTEDILAQCCHIKMLFTTRESLDYLEHKIPVHLEKVGVLDKDSSASLVKCLLPNRKSDDVLNFIPEVCGHVPLAMRLMCSIIVDENTSVNELLEELKDSPLIEVLDNESFCEDARLKALINTSFKRLSPADSKAFVSLAVFPGDFRIEEARSVLGLKERPESFVKRTLISLARKSLLDSNDEFTSFAIHSLLRSFVDEEKAKDRDVGNMYLTAQLRFYKHYITSFSEANKLFLTGHSNDAIRMFFNQSEAILSSLVQGTKEDELYSQAVEVLSIAELFLYSISGQDPSQFNNLYQTALVEAERRQCSKDERELLAAKSFGRLGWFYLDSQDVDQPFHAGDIDPPFPAKYALYLGVNELLRGKLDKGITAVNLAVDRLANGIDERVLRVLAYHILAVCYSTKEDTIKASHFEFLCRNELETSSLSPALCSFFVTDSSLDTSFAEACLANQDAFFFVLLADLLPSLYKALGNKTEPSSIVRSLVRMQNVLLVLFEEGSLPVRVLETCCNALQTLGCNHEAAEGFLFITDQLKNALGNHEDTAQNYHLLGLVQDELKNFNAASLSFEKAFDIRMQLFQENNDATLDTNMVRKIIWSLTCYTNSLGSLRETYDGQSTVDLSAFCDLNKLVSACVELESFSRSRPEEFDAEVYVSVVRIYDHLGSFALDMKRSHSEALKLYQRASKIREECLKDYKELSKTVIGQGAVYLREGRYFEAEKSFQQELDKRQRLGIKDTITAYLYYRLGRAHFEQGKYEVAAKQFQAAGELLKVSRGCHNDTAASFYELSGTYLFLNNYSEALDAGKQALTMRLSLSPEHIDRASSYHLLGDIHFKMNDLKKATWSFKMASELRSKLLGNHIDTATSYYCLGFTQYKSGQISHALVPLQMASTLRENILGLHAETATAFEILGGAYFHLGDKKKALVPFQKVVDMRSRLLGDHIDTARSHQNLGSSQLDTGDATGALESFQMASRMREELLGNHEDTAESYHNFGISQFKTGDASGALESFHKTSRMREEVLGNHLDTACSYESLGKVCCDMYNYNAALEAFQKVIDIRSNLGADHENEAFDYIKNWESSRELFHPNCWIS